MTDHGLVDGIRTERLLLRRWRDADRQIYAAINADPDVMTYLGGPQSAERSDAHIARIEAHWDAHGWGLWAVEVPDVASCIGFVGLWPAASSLGWEAVEVGWRLARAQWGRGYATEAARRALAFGFDDVGLDEIVSFTVPANRRSRAVMERISMQHDPADDFDHPRVDPATHPELVRHVLYRLDRATWEATPAVRPSSRDS